jgi:hypothetical protein
MLLNTPNREEASRRARQHQMMVIQGPTSGSGSAASATSLNGSVDGGFPVGSGTTRHHQNGLLTSDALGGVRTRRAILLDPEEESRNDRDASGSSSRGSAVVDQARRPLVMGQALLQPSALRPQNSVGLGLGVPGMVMEAPSVESISGPHGAGDNAITDFSPGLSTRYSRGHFLSGATGSGRSGLLGSASGLSSAIVSPIRTRREHHAIGLQSPFSPALTRVRQNAIQHSVQMESSRAGEAGSSSGSGDTGSQAFALPQQVRLMPFSQSGQQQTAAGHVVPTEPNVPAPTASVQSASDLVDQSSTLVQSMIAAMASATRGGVGALPFPIALPGANGFLNALQGQTPMSGTITPTDATGSAVNPFFATAAALAAAAAAAANPSASTAGHSFALSSQIAAAVAGGPGALYDMLMQQQKLAAQAAGHIANAVAVPDPGSSEGDVTQKLGVALSASGDQKIISPLQDDISPGFASTLSSTSASTIAGGSTTQVSTAVSLEESHLGGFGGYGSMVSSGNTSDAASSRAPSRADNALHASGKATGTAQSITVGLALLPGQAGGARPSKQLLPGDKASGVMASPTNNFLKRIFSSPADPKADVQEATASEKATERMDNLGVFGLATPPPRLPNPLAKAVTVSGASTGSAESNASDSISSMNTTLVDVSLLDTSLSSVSSASTSASSAQSIVSVGNGARRRHVPRGRDVDTLTGKDLLDRLEERKDQVAERAIDAGAGAGTVHGGFPEAALPIHLMSPPPSRSANRFSSFPHPLGLQRSPGPSAALAAAAAPGAPGSTDRLLRSIRNRDPRYSPHWPVHSLEASPLPALSLSHSHPQCINAGVGSASAGSSAQSRDLHASPLTQAMYSAANSIALSGSTGLNMSIGSMGQSLSFVSPLSLTQYVSPGRNGFLSDGTVSGPTAAASSSSDAAGHHGHIPFSPANDSRLPKQ